MKWVTRARPQVDRIACPWLIKRFVDPEAEFLYAPRDEVMAVAQRVGATPYDVPDVELGHHGDECSFDAIVAKYRLAADNPAIAQGFGAVYDDDHEQLAAEMPVYDALYAWCRKQAGSQ